jgi:hypothetical protein
MRAGELGDPAQVCDVLDVPGQIVGIVDDDVVDGGASCVTLARLELWPETDESRRHGTDERSDVGKFERADEGAESVERHKAQTGNVESGLQRRHDLGDALTCQPLIAHFECVQVLT